MKSNLTKSELVGIYAAIAFGFVGMLTGIIGSCQGRSANQTASEANNLSKIAVRLQSETDLRPYVWMDWDVKQEKASDQEPYINYQYINTGRSPAYNMRKIWISTFTKFADATFLQNSDAFITIYPEERSSSQFNLRSLVRSDTPYAHNFMMYEYHLPAGQNADSVITYIRMQTLLFKRFDFYSIGSSDTFIFGKVKDCSLHYHHPEYSISDIKRY